MPIEVIPGERAWATYRSNALARWPTREDPERLYPLADPRASGTFRLRGDERVFCIGSCFAREVENALRDLGFAVLSIMQELPRSPNRLRSDRGMFNKYNVATILNELRWAFGEGTPYRHDDVLIGAPGDLLLQDYQLAGPSYAEEPGQARAFREAFNAFFRTIREADLVVITLGLSEAWLDTRTGLYLNHAPTEHVVASYPGRFELHVLDPAQTEAMLAEIDSLLVRHLKPDFRLMLTVSPVPLWSTFRDQDVLVANAYSKAVLRASVDAFVARRAHASYFPSYEYVVHSHPLLAWRADDFRHVDPLFVECIMASALAQYGGDAQRTLAQATRARLLERGSPESAVRRPAAGAPWWKLWLGRALKRRRPRSASAATAPARVKGNLDRWDGRSLTGWAFDPQSAGALQISVALDGSPIAGAKADIERADVAQEFGEARRYSGFDIRLDTALPRGAVLSVSAGGHLLKSLPIGDPRDA